MKTVDDQSMPMREEDRELDDRLRLAMMDEAPDVSQLLSRVRREMQPGVATRLRSSSPFVLRAVAAALLVTVITGGLMIQARRNAALAVDAACDHFDELVQVSDKKWATAPADVDAYVQQHFPDRRDIVGALTPPGASFQKLASCRLLSARFAHFVYRANGRDVSVFVRISDPGNEPVRRVDYADARLRLQVSGFIAPGYDGLVVAAISSAATRDIADTVAGRL
ncbi:MAG TPA: hypothetical protein VFL80_01590 [Thermoanaerobaculia bacterium]|nr:hypothetical protein [Thermoanaerobaculia bacterium]